MGKIGSTLIVISFITMAFELHLKNPLFYFIFILMGFYVFFSALIYTPKNIIEIMRSEGLTNNKTKGFLIKVQVLALSITILLYFVLRIFDNGLTEVVWWIIATLILTTGLTIVFLSVQAKK